MTKELSALLDGELEMHEEAALWATLKAEPQLRGRWQDYKLISDAIRAEANLGSDLTAKVMRDLADEPVVLTPRIRPSKTWSSAIMALAASVAGVAVVGWLALAPQAQTGGTTALVAAKQQQQSVAVASTNAGQQGLQEYVLAHQANAPGLYLQGGTQHIRTVSVTGVNK
jgi:sigma-E factor negative regulatory protein RseA